MILSNASTRPDQLPDMRVNNIMNTTSQNTNNAKFNKRKLNAAEKKSYDRIT